MNWIKWFHKGVPDEEGEEREKAREKLAKLRHCEPCTALSGCFFVFEIKPDYPQHIHCDCLLIPIAVSYGDINAYCKIDKMTGYLFRYDNSGGKTTKFEEWGYHIGDSENLKAEFENQAKEKYANGEYTINKLDRYGQRITILISLQDRENNVRIFKTGWLVHPSGLITCATPFSGVVK